MQREFTVLVLLRHFWSQDGDRCTFTAVANPFGGFHLESVLMQQVRAAEGKCQPPPCPAMWHSPFSQGASSHIHSSFLTVNFMYWKRKKKERNNKKTMHQVPVILEAELFHRAIHHAQKSAHGDCQYRRSWNQHRWWGQDLPLFTAPWLCFDPIYIMTPCPRKYPYLPIPQSKITLFSKQYLFSCWLSHPMIHTHSHHSHYYFFFFLHTNNSL